jgi:hypothetical protein
MTEIEFTIGFAPEGLPPACPMWVSPASASRSRRHYAAIAPTVFVSRIT